MTSNTDRAWIAGKTWAGARARFNMASSPAALEAASAALDRAEGVFLSAAPTTRAGALAHLWRVYRAIQAEQPEAAAALWRAIVALRRRDPAAMAELRRAAAALDGQADFEPEQLHLALALRFLARPALA